MGLFVFSPKYIIASRQTPVLKSFSGGTPRNLGNVTDSQYPALSVFHRESTQHAWKFVVKTKSLRYNCAVISWSHGFRRNKLHHLKTLIWGVIQCKLTAVPDYSTNSQLDLFCSVAVTVMEEWSTVTITWTNQVFLFHSNGGMGKTYLSHISFQCIHHHRNIWSLRASQHKCQLQNMWYFHSHKYLQRIQTQHKQCTPGIRSHSNNFRLSSNGI